MLPKLSERDRRLLRPTDEDEDSDHDAEAERVRDLVRQWKADSARQGRPLKLPRSESQLVNRPYLS